MLLTRYLEKIKEKKLTFYLLILVICVFLVQLFFRYPMHDETYYLRETVLLSKLISTGEWFGNYGVGLHGFLFKLPLALIFILTGPNVIVATIYNYILAGICAFVLFKIGNLLFKNSTLSLFAVLLTVFSFEFIRSTPTYLREIPSLLSVLLFLYFYIKGCKNWLLSLSLLFVLDAKEYMFLIIGAGYTLSEIIILLREKDFSLKRIIGFILNQIIVYSLSLIYIVLMFTTSIIPLNTFIAVILGITEKGQTWNAVQFSTVTALTNNLNSGDVKEIGKLVYTGTNEFISLIYSILNIIIGYIGKFLYPRSFSFLSIPKIILIPSLVGAFYAFKDYFLKSDRKMIIFNTIFVFMFIYFIRNSQGRYLFTISPLIFISLINFVFVAKKNIKVGLYTILFAWIFEALGLYFEVTWVIPKMIASLILLISFLFVILNIKENRKIFTKVVFVFILPFLMISSASSLAYSYSQGQIFHSLKFGREFESKEIVKNMNNSDIYILNDVDTNKLIQFYLKDYFVDPNWKYSLKKSIPKSPLLETLGEKKIFLLNEYELIKKLKEDNAKLVIFKSKYSKIKFENQDLADSLLNNKEYKLEKQVDLKGKIMYIFGYNEDYN